MENMQEMASTPTSSLDITQKSILLDSAILYVVPTGFNLDNFDVGTITDKCLGMTQGGADFKSKPTIKDIKFDGSMGKDIKGSKRITGWVASVEVNALELIDSTFTISLLQGTKITNGSKYIPMDGMLQDEAYQDVLIVGNTTNGKEIVILLRDCFNNDGFNLKTEDEKESTCKLSLSASYQLNADYSIKSEPFEIRILN